MKILLFFCFLSVVNSIICTNKNYTYVLYKDYFEDPIWKEKLQVENFNDFDYFINNYVINLNLEIENLCYSYETFNLFEYFLKNNNYCTTNNEYMSNYGCINYKYKTNKPMYFLNNTVSTNYQIIGFTLFILVIIFATNKLSSSMEKFKKN